jgi:hypothetical protein
MFNIRATAPGAAPRYFLSTAKTVVSDKAQMTQAPFLIFLIEAS